MHGFVLLCVNFNHATEIAIETRQDKSSSAYSYKQADGFKPITMNTRFNSLIVIYV